MAAEKYEKEVIIHLRKKAKLKKDIEECQQAYLALESERKGGHWGKRKEGACPYDDIVDHYYYDSEEDEKKYKALNMGIDEGKGAVLDKKFRLKKELSQVESLLEEIEKQL